MQITQCLYDITGRGGTLLATGLFSDAADFAIEHDLFNSRKDSEATRFEIQFAEFHRSQNVPQVIRHFVDIRVIVTSSLLVLNESGAVCVAFQQASEWCVKLDPDAETAVLTAEFHRVVAQRPDIAINNDVHEPFQIVGHKLDLSPIVN